ncbi:hypothetical protein M3610_12150 [Neobacillus sp. MER 74]|uniref:hypothetical protein n=1 Tax=Neobacillus sp. MER 74 TaxID=2939566 RepID=UPI00203D5E0E|nr:hypothetical protein [Neobacillus sp. MER 74]MCM3116047.1 hypothetical protein [Neobacillus sp. MER 74]
MKKLNKYIEFITTKFRTFFKQSYFNAEGVTLKYMFDKCSSSKDIVVIFSACTRKGIKARYNYVRTLKDVEVNKLFILDDFGVDSRGCYYLGVAPEYQVEKATKHLIEMITKKVNAEKVIFCGSSKGGWAALNFGIEVENSVIIAGAPQYLLGNYLNCNANMHILDYINGKGNIEESVNDLNKWLKYKIENKEIVKNQTIYLHYSEHEHTYEEHIKFLISDLDKSGLSMSKDVKNYTDHWDVSKYFPEFLIKSIDMELINK